MAKRFGLLDCDYVSTPMDPSAKLTSIDDSQQPPPDPKLYRAMVGSLMYAQSLTHGAISFPVTALSRYLAKPTHAHMNAAKRVIA